jgi:hypothetical protein
MNEEPKSGRASETALLTHCVASKVRAQRGSLLNVPLAVEARGPSTIIAEASRLLPMANVPSFRVPPISVRSIPIGPVPVASLPVAPVPVSSAPVLIALSPETTFHMKGARAAAMKAGASSSDRIRLRQEHAGEANGSDGDNRSRGHQFHDSNQDGLRRTLSLRQSPNSTASPIKQVRWLKCGTAQYPPWKVKRSKSRTRSPISVYWPLIRLPSQAIPAAAKDRATHTSQKPRSLNKVPVIVGLSGDLSKSAERKRSAVGAANRCGRLWGWSRPREKLTRSGTCRGT